MTSKTEPRLLCYDLGEGVTAFSTTRRNSPVSITNASEGVTTTLAFGCFFLIFQQAKAMQGAVLRAQGSAKILLSGISGNCSRTISMYFSEVTTHIFSLGQTPSKRSAVN